MMCRGGREGGRKRRQYLREDNKARVAARDLCYEHLRASTKGPLCDRDAARLILLACPPAEEPRVLKRLMLSTLSPEDSITEPPPLLLPRPSRPIVSSRAKNYPPDPAKFRAASSSPKKIMTFC